MITPSRPIHIKPPANHTDTKHTAKRPADAAVRYALNIAINRHARICATSKKSAHQSQSAESALFSLEDNTWIPETSKDEEELEKNEKKRISAVDEDTQSSSQNPSEHTKETIETDALRSAITSNTTIARALLKDNHTALAMRYLATHIGDFCSSLESKSQSIWEANLPLRDDILPHSHLWLKFSQGILNLRFTCKDSDARQLVFNGRRLLEEMLHTVLNAPCEVNIYVE